MKIQKTLTKATKWDQHIKEQHRLSKAEGHMHRYRKIH